MTDETLQEAINWLNTSAPKTNIKGRDYTQVATRVEAFRRFFGTHYGITTELLPVEAENLVRVRATIANGDGAVLATGMAEEDRRAGNINKTSALENCETSAIGRALAAFGLHGGEFATANEVEGARAQESAQKQAPKQQNSGQQYEIVNADGAVIHSFARSREGAAEAIAVLEQYAESDIAIVAANEAFLRKCTKVNGEIGNRGRTLLDTIAAEMEPA